MRFTVRRMKFGQTVRPEEEDEEGLPLPKLIRLRQRRALGIKEAHAILEHLPEPGESLHCLISPRMDLTDAVNHLLERRGHCDRLLIATLGYNARNLRAMLGWIDSGAVGQLWLLASIFYLSHNRKAFELTLEEFRKRGQRAACCHCHAKVIALEFTSGERFVIEGSSNLCGNGSAKEQITLVNDPGLTQWHATWIQKMAEQHEGDESRDQQTG
jgi:hypothetical protein